MEYRDGEKIEAMYHDNKRVSGIILSSRQQYRGHGHPTTTTYTIKPNRPVMAEISVRDRLIIGSDMIIEMDYEHQCY